MTRSTAGEPFRRSSDRRNVALYVLALVLAAAAALGGVLCWQERGQRERAAAEQERYGEVLAAATAEAQAFVNLRYDDAQASIDRVAAGATGAFRKRYDGASRGVLKTLRDNRSVMQGSVVWAGVVRLDGDRATVIAATTGTLANVNTDHQPATRNLRLRLGLVLRDGAWLTNDLQYVN